MNPKLRQDFQGIDEPAELGILVALENATPTKGYAEELARRETDKDVRFREVICSEAYGVVKDSFMEAKKQFDGGGIDAVNVTQNKAVQPIKDCDFAFSRTCSRTNPLMERNRP